METKSVSRFAIAGGILILLGLLTGLLSGVLGGAQAGRSAFYEAWMGGTLLIAIGGVWRRRVKLARGEERAAIVLLIAGAYANWVMLVLAAVWGNSRVSAVPMPGRIPQPWQENFVDVLAASSAFAAVLGIVLAIRGLLSGRNY